MRTNRGNQTLALTGMAAFAAYVLACQPGFSPDSSQILFPALHPEASQVVVLRYDRKTGKTETVFVLGRPVSPHNPTFASAVWLPDGREAAVAWGGQDKKLNVAVLPLESPRPTRIYEVPLSDEEESLASLVFSPLVHGRYLFVGGKVVSRVDLASGEVKTAAVDQSQTEEDEEKAVYLIGQGNDLHYLAGDEDALEIGRIDPESLKVTSQLTLETKDEKLSPFAAFSKDGSQLAIPGVGAEGSKISIIRGSTLERTIPVGTIQDPVRLGNLAWARDETTLYATALKDPAPGDQRHRLFVLEIPLAGGAIKATPFGPLEEETEGPLLSAQLALSPDGKTLAISTAYAFTEELTAEDRALYLIDLETPDRKVTRIRMPWAR